MDATSAPHRIPPEMPQYGEDYHIFEMMQVTRHPRIDRVYSYRAGPAEQSRGIHFFSFPTCEIPQ